MCCRGREQLENGGHGLLAMKVATREEGTTLVEVMVSALIAVVLVGAILSVVISQASQRRSTTEQSLALGAALNNLEQLRAVPIATLPTLDGTGFDVPGLTGQPIGLNPIPGDPDGLPGEFTIVVDQTSGSVILYRVIATVAWRTSR